MKRRTFISLLGSAAAWPLTARAQGEPGKVYRLGQLSGGTAASRVPLLAAFVRGMRDLGYVEGQNLVVEHRYAEGRFEVLPALARELLAWNPDVLFVSTTPASLAAKSGDIDRADRHGERGRPAGGGSHREPRVPGATSRASRISAPSLPEKGSKS
jgi:hypothetical protein